MEKMLFITPNNLALNNYGGSKLSNYMLNFFTKKYSIHILTCSTKDIFKKTIYNHLYILIITLCGFMGNNSIKNLFKYFKILRHKKISLVYFDGSYYGYNIILTKLFYPKIKIVTLFHNLEHIFYREGLKINKFYLFKMLTAYLNDMISLKYSDVCLVISEEDLIFAEKHKVKAHLIFPDIFARDINPASNNQNHNDIGFIGSGFHGNILLLKKFIIDFLSKNSLSHLHIYGNGYNQKDKEYFSQFSNITFHGSFVDEYDIVIKHSTFLNSGLIKTGIQIKSLLYMKANRLILSYSPIFMKHNYSESVIIISSEYNEVDSRAFNNIYSANMYELFKSSFDIENIIL